MFLPHLTPRAQEAAMPPRPFSEVVPGGGWSWGTDVLRQRPEHAALVASAIATWSHVEFRLAALLATIMKGSARAAVEMLEELRSFDRKSLLVRRVARIELCSIDADLIEAVLGVVGPSAKIRNQFTHHFWGICTEIEDGILLAPPDLQRDVDLYGLELQHRHPRYREREQPKMGQHSEHILVYRLADLDEVLVKFGRAVALMFNVEFCLRMDRNWEGEREELIRELREAPDIAAELTQRAAQKARRQPR